MYSTRVMYPHCMSLSVLLVSRSLAPSLPSSGGGTCATRWRTLDMRDTEKEGFLHCIIVEERGKREW